MELQFWQKGTCTMNQPSYRRSPDLFWPIMLIGVGVILLLWNTGVIQGNPWPIVFNLWPVILIAIGLDILFGRRSLLGGLIGAILGLALIGGIIALLIAQPNWPGFNWGNASLQSRHIEAPLAGIETASIQIDFTSGENRLYVLTDSDKLINGDVSYYGDLTFDVNASNDRANVRVDSQWSGFFVGFMTTAEKWDIGLNPKPVYDITLDMGSGGGSLDLSKLNVSGGRLNVGSGGVDVRLPATGKFTLNVDGGSGSLNIHVPSTVGLRVEYQPGSGGFYPSSRLNVVRTGRDAAYETENFATAQSAITLIVDGGSGSISVTDSE
jgi:hypothetical protein